MVDASRAFRRRMIFREVSFMNHPAASVRITQDDRVASVDHLSVSTQLMEIAGFPG